MSKQEVQYKVKIQGEVEDLLKKLGTVEKEMSKLSVGDSSTVTRSIDQIEKSLNKLMDRTAAPITSKAMFDNLSKEAALINQDILRVMETIIDFSDLAEDKKLSFLPEGEQKKIANAEKALKSYVDTKDESVKKSKEHVDAEKDLAALQKKIKDYNAKIPGKEEIVKNAKKELDLYRQQADELNEKKAALSDYIKAQAKLASAKTDKGKANAEVDVKAAKEKAVSLGIKEVDTATVSELNQLLSHYVNAARDASTASSEANEKYRESNRDLRKLKENLQEAEGQYAITGQEVDNFNKDLQNQNAVKRTQDYQNLINTLKNLGVSVDGIPLEASEDGFKQLQAAVAAFKQQGLDAAQASVDSLRVSLTEMGITTSQISDIVDNSKEAFIKLDEKAAQSEAFTERIKQFVGLQGAALIARHAVQNAMATIKELDATMTEMAVVTDLTVGDYWKQLPEYSKQASELGVSINAAYEAATLYYQQGLKGNEVTKISAQTLKMARIAGLSAADATDKMTAALRGFNMEINEDSAQKVADVYSKLAAITAANVNEISSAMSKTASIASSAGMEFETTAAFLAQIVETTRESAETAGTALKTVIARFQELKKDPSEIGEIDGEIVDANKIETALRSVGVALRDSSGQFRDLDDVFMELSEKWNTLDTNTQRYIATIAAGSRQQSRFIAMMSDYNRTQDLVTAANNSAGASNEQFQKTMDSLQSKLEKLKNAWDTFTMSIMDSDILKLGVDLLTKILETINKITDAFGPLSGAAKIGVLVAGLYAGDNALKVFQNTLKQVNDEGQRVNGVFDALGAVFTSAADGIKNKFEGIKASIASTRTMLQDLSKFKMEDFASGKVKMFGEGGVLNKTKGQSATKESKEEIISRTNETMSKSDKKADSASKKIAEAEKKLSKATQDRTKAIEKQKAAIKSKEAIQKSNVGNEENRLKRIALLDKQAENNKQIELQSTKDITAAKSQITKQTNQLEAAQKASQAALMEQAAARGFDNAQMQTALGLQSLDIAQDATMLQNLGLENAGQAAQAATLGGLTMAKMADYEASMIAAGLDEEEIARRKGLIFQLFAQTGAEGLKTTAENVENATQVTGIALLWSKITAGAANIANLITQTAAQWGLNTAVIAGCPPMLLLAAVILIVVAAIALAVLAIVGLVAMFKKVQENTIDGQIAKSKERLEEFTEASEAAKDSLDEMQAAQDEYNNLQDAFKDLVEGTQEWNKALLEANANVLSLIQKYPELAGYMENIDGRLTINEEGWEKLQEKQMQVVQNTQLAVQRENVNLLQLQGQQKTEELYDKTGQIQASKVSGMAASINPMGILPGGAAIGAASAAIQTTLSEATEEWGVLGDVLTHAAVSLVNPVGAFTGLIAEKFVEPVEKESKEKTGELAKRALEEGISLDESDKTEFAELYKEIFNTEMTDEFYNNLQENADEFFELGAHLNAAEAALESYSDSLIAAAAEDTVEASEWGAAVEKAMQNSITGQETQEAIDQKKKDIKKETTKKEAMQMYAEQMGYTYHKGKVYKTNDINEVGDDTKMDLDMDIVYEQLAQAAVKNDYAAQAKNAAKVLEGGKFENEKDKQQTMRIMGGDAKDLTTSDLKAIQDAGGIEEYLKARNINPEELGIDLDSLNAETIEKTQKQNEKTKNEIAATLKLEDTSQLDAAFEGLTAKQMKAMETQYENLTNFYGPELGQKMLDLQSTMMAEDSPLSSDTQELLNQQMSTIDWSDASQIDGLTEQIAAMGDITEEERMALEQFEDAMIATAKATKKIDVGALKDMAKNLKDITSSIKGGDRNISKEQMEALKGAGVDVSQFAETAEGFRYLGTTADFIKEVSKAASAQLEETRQNFENIRENARQSMENYMEARRNLDSYTASQEEAEQQKLTGWEALAQWFKQLWEKIKSIFGAIWDSIKWAYNTYIKPVIEAIKNIVMQFWDMIVTVVNAVIKFFGDIWNWIGEKLVQGINAVIDLINKLPGVNIKKVSFNKVDTTGLKNSDQLKADQEKAKLEEELEKRKEQMLETLGELTEGLSDYTSSIYSLADSVDVGVLLAYQEQDKASAEESINKMQQAIIEDYGSIDAAPEELREAYEKLVEVKEEMDKTYDKALISKAMGLDGLEAEAHEFQRALESGNTEVAEDLKRKLANAISKKTAEQALGTMVESIQPIVEKIIGLGVESEDATRELRRLAYYLGFEDLDTGVEFVTENFNMLQYALEGDLQAWQNLQVAMAKGLGLNLDGVSSIGTSFDSYVKTNSSTNGNDVLDSLIGSGMYHVVEKVATEDAIVANIVYTDGEANLGENKTKSVKAGDTYYTIEALDADSLANIVEVSDFLSSYTQLELLNRDLEKVGRKREKAEEKYAELLEKENVSMSELMAAREEMFDAIEEEMRKNDEIRQVALANQQKAYADAIAKNSKFSNYVSIDANGEVTVDKSYAYANDLTDGEKKVFDEIISTLFDYEDTITEAQEGIDEGNKLLNDIKKEARDKAMSAFERTAEAIIKERQSIIDGLSEINDSITSANDKLLNSIQSQIDAEREQRDNKKTEDELSKSYSRLAYLSSASTGGDSLEKAELEKSIEEQEIEYQDTLIDQALTRLEDANEKAAEQRERQISLLETQLEAYQNSSQIWLDVGNLVWQAAEDYMAGTPLENTAWWNYLEAQEEWGKMNSFQNTETQNEVRDMFDGILVEGGFVSADGNTYANDVYTYFDGEPLPIEGEVTTKTVTTKETVYSDKTSAVKAQQEYDDFVQSNPLAVSEGLNNRAMRDLTQALGNTILQVSLDSDGNKVYAEPIGVNVTVTTLDEEGNVVDSTTTFQPNKTGLVRNKEGSISHYTGPAWIDGTRARPEIILNQDQSQDMFETINALDSGLWNDALDDIPALDRLRKSVPKLKQYKTGGVADFTGPAWLDGTKSKPEIILNQQDSANFIALKDILSEFMDGRKTTNGSSQTGGDNYYDIAINVEKIESDYDVEQMANRIKKLIQEDASYRNVQSVRFAR